jgi:hypothetical protein
MRTLFACAIDCTSAALRGLTISAGRRSIIKLTNMAFQTSFADFVGIYFEYQRLATASPEHRQAMTERRADRASRAR